MKVRCTKCHKVLLEVEDGDSDNTLTVKKICEKCGHLNIVYIKEIFRLPAGQRAPMI
jgi:phage FluMu protein Com